MSSPQLPTAPAPAPAPAPIDVVEDVASTHLQPYVQLTPARASTSTISTASSPPSLSPPSLVPVRSHSVASVPLVTPVNEVLDPMASTSDEPEKTPSIYRGRFVEMIEQDWEFRDEDALAPAPADESFEILALPRASISSERTTSTHQSEAIKGQSFVPQHKPKRFGISPSFSTSRLLATLGRKSKALWSSRKEAVPVDDVPPVLSQNPGGVTLVDEFGGVTQRRLSTIVENTTGLVRSSSRISQAVKRELSEAGGMVRRELSEAGGAVKRELSEAGGAVRRELSEVSGSFIPRRLSMRRRMP